MTTTCVLSGRRAVSAALRTGLRTVLVLGALWLVGVQSPLLAAESVARLVQVSGTVALVRADGSAVQPAPADTAIGPGDRVATVGNAGATVSIAGVGEITLGADTTIIVRELRAEGGGTVVLVEVVTGTTVHRVTDARAVVRYQVVGPGGQAIVDVRGAASFGVARDENGNLTVGCDRCPDGTVSFPSTKHGLGSGWARTLTARGDVVTERLGGGLLDALAHGAAAGEAGSKTADGNRAPVGQRTGSRDSRRNLNDNDDTPNNTAAAALPTVQATIASFVFLPDPIVVQVGQSIRWINLDFAEHTVTEDNHLFTSAVLNYGDTYTLTLLQPGTYNYFCEPHPQMTATIIVQ